MDLDDPRHGTPAGHKAGCTRGTCPQYPITCAESRRIEQADYRSRKKHDIRAGISEGAKVKYVLRRLEETIAKVGYNATIDRVGMATRDLSAIRKYPGALFPYDVAEQLDQAWSYLVHGSDTRSPDFKHANGVISYCYGYCRCHPCTAMQTRINAMNAAGYKRPESWVGRDVFEKVRRHALRLTENASAQQVSRACGVNNSTLHAILQDRPGGIAIETAKSILTTTPADVTASALRLDGEETYHLIHTLEALGYPLKWQSLAAGHGVGAASTIRPGKIATADIANDFKALAARIGDTQAGPSTGVPELQASKSRARALRSGWYPPVCYDDDRKLVERAIPGHPMAILDTRAELAVRACYLGGQGIGIKSIADRLGDPGCYSMLSKDSADFWGYSYGDRQPSPRARKASIKQSTMFDPVASRPRIREVSEVYNAMESGEIGPVTAALMLGKRFKNPPMGSRTHPELVAWLEANATAAEPVLDAAHTLAA